MRRFWFDGDAQYAPISLLSGGERRRLQLLLTLIEQPNVLLLDEPTNDLDLDTLRALEEFLDDWPGIVVVVSHDRVFLDRTVTEVLALDGRGGATVVRGGVAGWLAQRELAAGTRAPERPPARQSSPASSASSKPANAPSPSSKSPSTIRRQLGAAERALAEATAARDVINDELSGGVSDHRRLTELSARLAAAQAVVDSAESSWLELATDAEALGLEV